MRIFFVDTPFKKNGETQNFQTAYPESWLENWLYPQSEHYQDSLPFSKFLEDWICINWAYENKIQFKKYEDEKLAGTVTIDEYGKPIQAYLWSKEIHIYEGDKNEN